MKTLVVGAGGLLGRAVTAAARRRPELAVIPATVAWSDERVATRQLAELLDLVTRDGEPWQVLWCAGAGVNGMTTAQFDAEVRQLERFLVEVERVAPRAPGLVFLASSAGGVFAGAVDAPFDEQSAVAPLSPYGVAKLQMERVLGQFHERTGVPVLAGRFSNLYGPGQNLTKQQGLISHLCLGSIERRPVSIFVSLDTIRDYLYVNDAAEMLLDAVDALRSTGLGSAMKIFAAQQGTTIATLIASVNAAAGSKPPIILGSSALAAFQSTDIRLRSRVLTSVDDRPLTPLAVGIARTWASLLQLYVQVGRRP